MIKLKSNWNKRSEFTKNILRLVSGTAVAQLISILISPLLTRLYTKEEFGLFTIIASIFGFVGLVAGGRYEVAILLPKKDKNAANVLVLSLLINSLFSILLFFIIFLIDNTIFLNSLEFWYYLLPLFVFLLGITQSITAWFNRKKKYQQIAISRISISSFTNGFSLINGMIKLKSNGLLWASLIASIANVGVLYYQLRKEVNFIQSSFSLRKMKLLARKFIRFPMINSFQALLDASQINGLIYLIAYLFGKQVVGVFALSVRILYAPMNFIGSSIAQVFYQELSFAVHDRKMITPILRKTMLQSAVMMTGVLVVILILGPELFAIVFGEKWRSAGVFAQYLSPWICLDFIRAPLSQIPLVLDKQKQMLIISVTGNIVTLAAIILSGIFVRKIEGILLVLSLVQVVYLIIIILWFIRISSTYDRSLSV